MYILYTEKYWPRYLDLSIAIFHTTRYPPVDTYDRPPEGAYRSHPEWNEFLALLKEADIKQVLIFYGATMGSIGQYYFHMPLFEDGNMYEAGTRERNRLVEEIEL